MTYHTDGDLPKETHRASLNIAGHELTVINLDNGQRLFEAESFQRFLKALFAGEIEPTEEEVRQLALTTQERSG